MLIGITGQIGAGKSTVADVMVELGAVVVDADIIGRQVVDNSTDLLAQLRDEFGNSIVDPHGKLMRERLAELAFVSEERKARLNEIVHPHLLRELRRQVSETREKVDLVVVDAALLLDWNLDSEMDETWVVCASESVRMQRLMARGMSRSDAISRQRVQLPLSEFETRADQLIENNGSVDMLRSRVWQLLNR